MCILQGRRITPEMPGICARCSLYLNTCIPTVEDGYLVGAECDYDYCCDCPYYDECGRMKGEAYGRQHIKKYGTEE